MTWYVYVLAKENVGLPACGRSGSRDTYVGMTNNVQARIIEHNSGKCYATRGCSWRLVAVATCGSRAIAAQLERYLKCGDSRDKRVSLMLHADAGLNVSPVASAAMIMQARMWTARRRYGNNTREYLMALEALLNEKG